MMSEDTVCFVTRYCDCVTVSGYNIWVNRDCKTCNGNMYVTEELK